MTTTSGRRCVAVCLLAWSSGAALAQDPPTTKPSDSRPAESSPSEEYRALESEWRRAEGEYLRPLLSAKDSGAAPKLDDAAHPRHRFRARYRDFYARTVGAPERLDAALWLVRQCRLGAEPRDAAIAAYEAFLADAAAVFGPTPDGLRLAKALSFSDRLTPEGPLPTLRRLAALAPAATRSAVRYALAQALAGSPAGPTAEERKEATAILRELAASPDTPAKIAAAVAEDLYLLDRLGIGATAPDFTAVDADGVSFRLSDYRGKVVVLDFWGFW
jgi:hypothetical protein